MKWEVRRVTIEGDNPVLSWGETEASFPTARERKVLRRDGHKIYVDGKVFKEPDGKEKAE